MQFTQNFTQSKIYPYAIEAFTRVMRYNSHPQHYKTIRYKNGTYIGDFTGILETLFVSYYFYITAKVRSSYKF